MRSVKAAPPRTMRRPRPGRDRPPRRLPPASYPRPAKIRGEDLLPADSWPRGLQMINREARPNPLVSVKSIWRLFGVFHSPVFVSREQRLSFSFLDWKNCNIFLFQSDIKCKVFTTHGHRHLFIFAFSSTSFFRHSGNRSKKPETFFSIFLQIIFGPDIFLTPFPRFQAPPTR